MHWCNEKCMCVRACTSRLPNIVLSGIEGGAYVCVWNERVGDYYLNRGK